MTSLGFCTAHLSHNFPPLSSEGEKIKKCNFYVNKMTNFVFLLVLRNGNLAEKELIFKENNNESVRKKNFCHK